MLQMSMCRVVSISIVNSLLRFFLNPPTSYSFPLTDSQRGPFYGRRKDSLRNWFRYRHCVSNHTFSSLSSRFANRIDALIILKQFAQCYNFALRAYLAARIVIKIAGILSCVSEMFPKLHKAFSSFYSSAVAEMFPKKSVQHHWAPLIWFVSVQYDSNESLLKTLNEIEN